MRPCPSSCCSERFLGRGCFPKKEKSITFLGAFRLFDFFWRLFNFSIFRFSTSWIKNTQFSFCVRNQPEHCAAFFQGFYIAFSPEAQTVPGPLPGPHKAWLKLSLLDTQREVVYNLHAEMLGAWWFGLLGMTPEFFKWEGTHSLQTTLALKPLEMGQKWGPANHLGFKYYDLWLEPSPVATRWASTRATPPPRCWPPAQRTPPTWASIGRTSARRHFGCCIHDPFGRSNGYRSSGNVVCPTQTHLKTS